MLMEIPLEIPRNKQGTAYAFRGSRQSQEFKDIASGTACILRATNTSEDFKQSLQCMKQSIRPHCAQS